MAFNKTKALETALKSLSQGKVAQAISEYQLILRHDPKDQATLMTVGDLYARQGDMPHAIEYFERLAQVYINDGFNSKAIAIYKKIAKLAPAEPAPLERLADLYVQQGVLSEARPLFLQIAEAHLKANRAPKAIEVLQRLLEVEPENPRVQMRLAEIYNVLGRKKEAAQTYFAYAQRLFDRGNAEEARKLIDRALEVEPTHASAMFLKAKLLAAAQDDAQAITLLESHPEADAGEEVTKLLFDLQIRANRIEDAANRARKLMAADRSRFAMLLRVTDTLIANSRTDEAIPLLRELRDPMIDAGEQDAYIKSLTEVTEKLPGHAAPLEVLADFCRRASDPFHLADTLNQLAEIYIAEGNSQRAEEILVELVDRNKGNEKYVARLNALRGNTAAPDQVAEALNPDLHSEEPQELQFENQQIESQSQSFLLDESPNDDSGSETANEESPLDEETQHYIAQALTDVDLFSSYGLTQKATHLLENILQRAPRHTPTLERLLDMYLGSGNDRRTAETASQLQQIHGERGDQVNAERFGELRRRYQAAAGVTDEQLAAVALPASEAAPSASIVASAAVPARATPSPLVEEFNIEQMEAGAATMDNASDGEPFAAEFEIPVAMEDEAGASDDALPDSSGDETPSIAGAELDLSDEWEAMVLEVSEPSGAGEDHVISESPSDAVAPIPEPVSKSEPASMQASDGDFEIEIVDLPEVESHSAESALQGEPVAFAAEPTVELPSAEFELELISDESAGEAPASEMTTDDFLSDLAAEFADLEPLEISSGEPVVPPAPVGTVTALPAPQDPQEIAANLNELSAVFQEFRNEMGEMPQEEEDIETHYNLGIAYREMGLLDESIGEFQRVANSMQKGKPFDYAMNCFTFLALCFVEKGEPKIAAMWYERALEMPGLDPEAILALRYDLAMALEMAGEAEAALNRFRQVYAVNIDYRDVADHIATLQH